MSTNRRQMIRSLAAGGLLLPGMLSELLGEQAIAASDGEDTEAPEERPTKRGRPAGDVGEAVLP